MQARRVRLLGILGAFVASAAVTTCAQTGTWGSSLPATIGEPVALPAPSADGGAGLRQVLSDRRSRRAFADRALTLTELSQLLWAAQGVTDGEGHRTAPSAGALYPFEVYVVAQRVDGLEPGLYHYAIGDHTLAAVRHGDLAADLEDIAMGQRSAADAPASLLLVAVVARTSIKYGTRAEQYALIEGGAIVQAVSLQAVDLGLGTVCVGAFEDAALQAFIGTDAMPVAILPVGEPSG